MVHAPMTLYLPAMGQVIMAMTRLRGPARHAVMEKRMVMKKMWIVEVNVEHVIYAVMTRQRITMMLIQQRK